MKDIFGLIMFYVNLTYRIKSLGFVIIMSSSTVIRKTKT